MYIRLFHPLTCMWESCIYSCIRLFPPLTCMWESSIDECPRSHVRASIWILRWTKSEIKMLFHDTLNYSLNCKKLKYWNLMAICTGLQFMQNFQNKIQNLYHMSDWTDHIFPCIFLDIPTYAWADRMSDGRLLIVMLKPMIISAFW